MSYTKQPTLFFAPVACQEGLVMSDIFKEKQDISAAIIEYKQEFNKLTNQEGRFRNDILDSSGNLLPLNTLKDAVRNDIQTILIQENTMYIVGIITLASMILSAIIISR
jgi:hypothetical protein